MFPAHLRLEVSPSIILESVREEHAEALCAVVVKNRAHFAKYLPKVAEITTLEAARAHIERVQRLVGAGELLELHVFVDGGLGGALRLNYVEPENRKVALGYFLDADLQGRGVITQSARAVIGYAFEELGFNRIELRCATDNAASVRVAERLGFTREGELREAERLEHGPVNHFVYGLLRSEWPR